MPDEIVVYEWEILDLIRKEDSRHWNTEENGPYFLHYSRARYEDARDSLIFYKRRQLLLQNVDPKYIKIPDPLPDTVAGWGHK